MRLMRLRQGRHGEVWGAQCAADGKLAPGVRGLPGRLTVLIGLSLAGLLGIGAPVWGQTAPETLAPLPAAIVNGGFECPDGFRVDEMGRRVPTGWELVRFDGEPTLNSARMQYAGSCENDRGHVERMEGRDALVIRARDLETPPAPGKPFDVVLVQRFPVAPGGDYSVSGWMLSLCGGSAVPSDCPDGVYIRKAIGLDPHGGNDPASPHIVWTENLDNFVSANQERVGWSNLRVAARAADDTMSVFVRVENPFQWHGNHAFVDAIHLARAPVAWFVNLPRSVAPGASVLLRWDAYQSPEVTAIPGGTHEVLVDVQVRRANSEEPEPWRDVAVGASAPGECRLRVGGSGEVYELRLRARAEQPPPAPGAWPNQRFPGVWSDPNTVTVRTRAAEADSEMAATVATPALFGLFGVLFVPDLRDGRGTC